MQSFTKRPGESYPIAFEFKDHLPPGKSLTAGAAVATNTADDSDASSTVLSSTTATISGTQAIVTVQAGTAGIKYQIDLTATLSGGGSLEESLLMVVY